MNGNFFRNMVVFFMLVFGLGCAAAPQFTPTPFTPHQFDMDRYAAKVDTFLILFDASKSMTKWPYQGRAKINIAKDVVYHMNQTIPDVNMKAGLRVFGQNPKVASGETALLCGISQYSRAGLDKGLNEIQGPGENTPMSAALTAAGEDLAGTRGPMALILISDGVDPEIPHLPVTNAAKALKDRYGDQLCIYTIGVGDNAPGIARMKEIAQIGGCGFYRNAEELTSAAAMARFVEEVLLTQLMDSDGDGVYDRDDMCPDTPPGVKVDARGCPLPVPAPKVEKIKMAPPPDSDGDGVVDSLDKCPNTPMGVEVDKNGCWMTGMVHFDFDKSNIKTRYEPILMNIAAVMKKNPGIRLIINGHTDSIGTEAYNQGLSERRAQSAKQYLMDQGIDGYRLETVGHSFRQPIATNKTGSGRAMNRRDEFEVVH